MKRIYLIMAMIVAAMMMSSCVSEVEKATVETREVTDVTSSSVRVICNVSDDGGAEVSSRGVCWDTSENPTIETAQSQEAGQGIGNYECEINGLNSNTTYYVRAYATNSAGVSYGEEMNFNTLSGDEDNEGNENGDDNGDGDDNNNGDNDEDNSDQGGEIAGHIYVDLGLPSGLKWATCNIGADKPEDYGDYFAWGETETKSTYTVDNSATYGLSISQLQSQGIINVDNNLTPSHDAAAVNWGGSWRMPTKTEQEELINNCTWTWPTQNGVYGCKVTGPNGNSIFLPAAGCYNGSSIGGEAYFGGCLSSTPYNVDNVGYAYSLLFLYGVQEVEYGERHFGQTVRPVSE